MRQLGGILPSRDHRERFLPIFHTDSSVWGWCWGCCKPHASAWGWSQTQAAIGPLGTQPEIRARWHRLQPVKDPCPPQILGLPPLIWPAIDSCCQQQLAAMPIPLTKVRSGFLPCLRAPPVTHCKNTLANRLRTLEPSATLVLSSNEAASGTGCARQVEIKWQKNLKQLLRGVHQFARVVDGSRR